MKSGRERGRENITENRSQNIQRIEGNNHKVKGEEKPTEGAVQWFLLRKEKGVKKAKLGWKETREM